MKKITALFTLFAIVIVSDKGNAQQSIYWSDDFEGTISNWSATNGVWQTGTPTAGPASAHGGLKCAGTNLSGNYPQDITSSLITNQYIQIPSSTQNPRLRFWLWYSFATTNGIDYGKVQAKTASSSTWTNLSSFTYTANSSGVWSCEEVDLTAFADSSVQIGFLLYSHNDGYVSTGFYVDDVEIRTGPYIFINPEGFENDWRDWSAEGTWEIGTPTVGPASGCSGIKCAGTNLNGNYGRESNGHLKSTWIKLPPANQNPAISFCHWFSFATANGLDYGKLQFRTKTSGWKDTATYSSSSPLWTNVYFDMSSYADSVIQFGFFLQSLDDGYQSSGWYIDDVYISGLADTSYYPDTALATGLHVIENSQFQISIYPTLFISDISIAIDKQNLTNVQFSIKNILGQTLFSEQEYGLSNTYTKKIDLSFLPKGIYLVEVIIDGERTVKKIMKR